MLYCRLFSLRKHKLLFPFDKFTKFQTFQSSSSLSLPPSFCSNNLARTTRRSGKKLSIRPRSPSYRSFTRVSIKNSLFPSSSNRLIFLSRHLLIVSSTSVGFLHSPSMQRRFYSINCVVTSQQSHPTRSYQTDHHPPCSPCIPIFPDS